MRSMRRLAHEVALGEDVTSPPGSMGGTAAAHPPIVPCEGSLTRSRLERASRPLPGAWVAQPRRIPPSSRHRDRTVPASGPPRARLMKRGAEVTCPASPLPPGVRDQRGRDARRRASRGPLGPSEERRSRNATVVARPRKRRGWVTSPKRGRRGVSRPAGPARTSPPIDVPEVQRTHSVRCNPGASCPSKNPLAGAAAPARWRPTATRPASPQLGGGGTPVRRPAEARRPR